MADPTKIKFSSETLDITPASDDRILLSDTSNWWAASDAPLSSLPVSNATATAIWVVQADIDAHEARTDNPHSVTKAQVGLWNADNTSDLDKPISTATQTALNWKVSSVVAWTNISVDNTDPQNPVLNVARTWHTIQEDWVSRTQRLKLNFKGALTATDNAIDWSTDIDITTTSLAWYTITNAETDRSYNADSVTLTELANTVGTIVDDINFLATWGSWVPSDTVVTETTYWQSSTAWLSTEYARGDHTHWTPAAIDISWKADLSWATFSWSISATNLSWTNTWDQDLSWLTPNTRTLTINGTWYDLSADRTWTINPSIWTLMPWTPTRTSNTTFTVTWDVTSYITKWVIIKWTESSVVKCAMVSIPSTYWAPNTTITIVWDTMSSIDASSLKYCMMGAETKEFAVAWSIGATATDVARAYYAIEPMRVIWAEISVWTAWTTNSTTIDINKGWTTMFTTKPTLASTVAASTTPFTADSWTSLALNDKVTIDIDAVQTTAAVDLYVTLYLFPTRLINLS